MRKIVVTITQKDITEGRNGSDYICPFGLALGRTLGKVVNVRDYITIHDFRGPFSPLVNWIADWELGEPVQPESFILEIDD